MQIADEAFGSPLVDDWPNESDFCDQSQLECDTLAELPRQNGHRARGEGSPAGVAHRSMSSASLACEGVSHDQHGHREKVLPQGASTLDSLIMVHEPIPPKKVRFIPEAAEAVQKEWNKLKDQKAWDLSTVREMSQVKEEYRRNGKVAHFGRVFPLCDKNTQRNPRVNGNTKGV